MKKIEDINEIQRLQLDLLINFDKVCKENNLKYFLAGGTLLGAVRHKGFIPWDDDIDVSMPRRDYKKLLKIYNDKNVDLEIISVEKSHNYFMPFAKLVNRNYCNNENDNLVEKYGIFLDIFPLDGLGNTYKEAKRNALKVIYLEKVYYRCYRKNRLMKLFKNIKLPKLIYKMIIKILEKNKFEDSNYVGSIIGGRRLLDEIFEKKVYEDTVEMTFEGSVVSGMKYYDEYLKKMYGNYKELPPKEQQIPSHNVEIYDIRE